MIGSIPFMDRDELKDFREQCKRNLNRSVEERMRYGFNYVYKPVLDDADWRSFDSMEEYRRWCREHLPAYLGYGELTDLQRQMLEEFEETLAKKKKGRRTNEVLL